MASIVLLELSAGWKTLTCRGNEWRCHHVSRIMSWRSIELSCGLFSTNNAAVIVTEMRECYQRQATSTGVRSTVDQHNATPNSSLRRPGTGPTKPCWLSAPRSAACSSHTLVSSSTNMRHQRGESHHFPEFCININVLYVSVHDCILPWIAPPYLRLFILMLVGVLLSFSDIGHQVAYMKWL